MKKQPEWKEQYCEFAEPIGRIYDVDVVRYAKKHLRLIDRFDVHKMYVALMWSFDILNGSLEEPEFLKGRKNWKFFKDLF